MNDTNNSDSENNELITQRTAALNECLSHIQAIKSQLAFLTEAAGHHFHLPLDTITFNHGAEMASIRSSLNSLCEKIPSNKPNQTKKNTQANVAQ